MGNGSSTNNEQIKLYDNQLTVSEEMMTVGSAEEAHQDEKGKSYKLQNNN